MVSSLVIGVVILAVLILLDTIPKVGNLLSNVFLLVLFFFAIPNLEKNLGIYYSLMILGVFVLSTIVKTRDTSAIFGMKGVFVPLISIAFAGAIYFILTLMQTRSPTSIIGVPGLAVTGLFNTFSPAIAGSLGFVENRFFIKL